MAKVFFAVGVSLDGYMAGPNGGPTNPLGDGGTNIHRWVFSQKAFRETHGFGEGGETGPNNDFAAALIDRIGVNILGKNMFDEGEANWPENAPFHTPVYVLTHQKREPWVRPGGTTFYFTNDDIKTVLERAKEAAGDKDVRISGGADTIRQYLNAGLIDEFILSTAPIMMGSGVRMFDGVTLGIDDVEIVETLTTPVVSHTTFRIKKYVPQH